MEETKVVTVVSIVNRWDCCSERLTNYHVTVGNDPNVFANRAC
jgi:hypothetical protein